jgi:aldose sugar dehydrogenase
MSVKAVKDLTLLVLAIAAILLISTNLVHAEPTTINPKFVVERIFTGEFKPSTMAFLGPDDIIVLDRDLGKVYRIIDGVQSKPLLDVNVATVGYRGLLGVAVSANEKNIPNVFLYYTQAHKRDNEDEGISNPIEPLGNRVYRYELVNNKLVNPRLLLDLPAMPGPRHMGGVIAIGPDNNLYISVGDLDGTFRGKKYDTMSQNYQNSTVVDGRSGILRINQEGKPVGEGILGSTFPLNLYYAYGIRNSFGFDWDPLTGKLWDTENGPHYGDEINLVEPGFNSGWVNVQGVWQPNFEQMGKIVHNPMKLVLFNGKGKYSEPEFTWIPTVAPTALVFFTSDNYGADYKNTLFVGDANTGTLYHFKLNAKRSALELDGMLNDKIANSANEIKNVTFATGFGRITDVDLGPDGNLYVLSSENGLTVHKIIMH